LIADSSLAPSKKCTPQYNERATFGQAFLAQHQFFVNEKAGGFVDADDLLTPFHPIAQSPQQLQR